MKRFFTGDAIKADLLVTMLDKHGITAAQEFARKAEILFQHEPDKLKEVWLFQADLFKELGVFTRSVTGK